MRERTRSSERTAGVTSFPPSSQGERPDSAKLRAAKKAIEADAADKAGKKAAENAAKDGLDEDEIAKVAEVAAEKARPEKTNQRNFTDPEARMMKTNEGFQYAYNAQAVVDEESQVIIAAEVSPASR